MPSIVMRSIFLLLAAAASAVAMELTFDMDPHSVQCFYEIAKANDEITFEFQVSIAQRTKICFKRLKGKKESSVGFP
jgi:hypothetical protein